MRERRSHPRRPLVRNALLYLSQGFLYPCRVDNFSSDGLFIKTSGTRLYKGSSVNLAVDGTPHMTHPITTKATVMHSECDGIGLLCERNFPLLELLKDAQ